MALTGVAVVDEVRVVVTLGRHPDARARETFALNVTFAEPRPFEEQAWLTPLAPLMSEGSGESPLVLHVNRTHRFGGPAGGRAEIRLSLPASGAPSLEVVSAAYRSLREAAGAKPGAPLSRAAALSEAALRVEEGWPEVLSERLEVREEEHHRAGERWTIGLVSPDQTRFQVTLGLVDGDPATSHAVRRDAAEVVDSVSESG